MKVREAIGVSNLSSTSAPSGLRILAAPLPVGLATASLVIGWASGGSLLTSMLVAVVGFMVGLALTVLLSRAPKPGTKHIDPFGIGEPWRRYVQNALSTQKRFEEALRASSPGAIQDRLVGVHDTVRTGVYECWEAAQAAHLVSQARLKLDGWVLKTRYERLRREGNHEAAASVAAQLSSLERLDATIANTKTQIEIQVAKLAEAVTTAIEINVTRNRLEELTQVQTSLEQVADELEALRYALGETSVSGIGD